MIGIGPMGHRLRVILLLNADWTDDADAHG